MNNTNSKNLSKSTKNEKYSFFRGWGQLQQRDVKIAKRLIMERLGLTSAVGFYNRLNGTVEPKMSDVEAIESVFAEYGILDVWGAE